MVTIHLIRHLTVHMRLYRQVGKILIHLGQVLLIRVWLSNVAEDVVAHLMLFTVAVKVGWIWMLTLVIVL